jgi:ubiquinone/menaquinone biosynthesis C-methylase UbiE
LKKLRQYIAKHFSAVKETAPETAYDLWANSYDSQPDNLMLALDEEVFSTLLNEINLKDKVVADIGCGTGRHWKKILSKYPKKLVGFDVSKRMLSMLQQKFPQSETYRLVNNELNELKNDSCDIIISTLTIAHIREVEKAMQEWNRVLKPGGSVLITDYHPEALAKGGKRTFKYNDKTVAIKNYVHPIEKITAIARQLYLERVRLIEKRIDEPMKPWYEKQNALAIFESWKDIPIIYGILLKKKNVTE